MIGNVKHYSVVFFCCLLAFLLGVFMSCFSFITEVSNIC